MVGVCLQKLPRLSRFPQLSCITELSFPLQVSRADLYYVWNRSQFELAVAVPSVSSASTPKEVKSVSFLVPQNSLSASASSSSSASRITFGLSPRVYHLVCSVKKPAVNFKQFYFLVIITIIFFFSLFQCVHVFISLLTYFFVYLFTHLFIYLSFYLFIYLPIYFFTYYLFNLFIYTCLYASEISDILQDEDPKVGKFADLARETYVAVAISMIIPCYSMIIPCYSMIIPCYSMIITCYSMIIP